MLLPRAIALLNGSDNFSHGEVVPMPTFPDAVAMLKFPETVPLPELKLVMLALPEERVVARRLLTVPLPILAVVIDALE